MSAAVSFSAGSERRTEFEQAANAVWLLVAKGLISTEINVGELCSTVGISRQHLAEARRRFERGENLTARAWSQLEGGKTDITAPADWTPQPSGSHGKAVAKHVQTKNPAPGLRRCPGCAQTLPVTKFDRKTSKGRQLKSRCRSCTKRYQRDRYLTIRKAVAMDAALAFFTALDGDAVVGMTCPECDKAIQAGEQVSLEAAPRHAHHQHFKKLEAIT